MMLAQTPSYDPEFIERMASNFGSVFVLVLIALPFILVIWNRESKKRKDKEAVENEERRTSIEERRLINLQLSSLEQENNDLQKRYESVIKEISTIRVIVNALEHERDSANRMLELARTSAEQAVKALAEANVKITQLEKYTTSLDQQVKILQHEKDVSIQDLEREKLRNVKLDQELQGANARIVELGERMARYEGRNATLESIMSKLKVIQVEPVAEPTVEPVAL